MAFSEILYKDWRIVIQTYGAKYKTFVFAPAATRPEPEVTVGADVDEVLAKSRQLIDGKLKE